MPHCCRITFKRFSEKLLLKTIELLLKRQTTDCVSSFRTLIMVLLQELLKNQLDRHKFNKERHDILKLYTDKILIILKYMNEIENKN